MRINIALHILNATASGSADAIKSAFAEWLALGALAFIAVVVFSVVMAWWHSITAL